jgi:two-component system, NtrC family, sensor kinase
MNTPDGDPAGFGGTDRVWIKPMAQDDLAHTIERLADLGHLSAGVSHHVINAFSAIVSNAEILRLTANSPVAADPAAVADLIIRAAVDASAVARRLIDYTRSATIVGNARIPLDQIVADAVSTERDRCRPDVDWAVDLEPVPPILGHPVQLRAMMHHLVTNACEAMPEEGGTISIRTSEDSRGWAVLEIQDTGPGMDSPTLERAIEPFFTTKPGHFGIGLSIANGIWRRHRGTLALLSRAGEGTTVRLCVEPARD